MNPVHFAIKIAKQFKGAQPNRNPMRLARGVVHTSTIGGSMVLLDGETDVTKALLVNNLAHVASLTTGTVVEVLFTGNTGTIIGHY